MRIGIDAHHASELERLPMPAPVEVQAPGIGVDLDRNAMLGARAQDFFDVDVIAWAPEQLPAGHVSQDRGARIGDGPHDAIGLLLSAELEPAVYARHNEVEARQNII